MLISAFNALTLSPALCALLLKPRNAGRKSLFSPFHRLFNWCYGRVSNGYTRWCRSLARKLADFHPLLLLFWGAVAPVAERVPGGFLPDEDQGFLLACLILKPNTSLQVAYEQDKKFEAALQDPAVKNLTTVVGLNILNSVQTPAPALPTLSSRTGANGRKPPRSWPESFRESWPRPAWTAWRWCWNLPPYPAWEPPTGLRWYWRIWKGRA